MKGFKGFDKDLKCRDFQYTLGKTFTHDGKTNLCNSGFHFCENPLDIFGYYPPGSRFAEVESDDVSSPTDSDSKRVCKSLTIGAELSLSALCGAGLKFILDKVDFTNAKQSNTGNYSAATNTGDQSAATNTGNYSAATNTGNYSAATNTVRYTPPSNTGNYSAATNTGNYSAATNTGKNGFSISVGIEGKAS